MARAYTSKGVSSVCEPAASLTKEELDCRLSLQRNKSTADTYEAAAAIVMQFAAKHFADGSDDIARSLRDASRRVREEAQIFRQQQEQPGCVGRII